MLHGVKTTLNYYLVVIHKKVSFLLPYAVKLGNLYNILEDELKSERDKNEWKNVACNQNDISIKGKKYI